MSASTIRSIATRSFKPTLKSIRLLKAKGGNPLFTTLKATSYFGNFDQDFGDDIKAEANNTFMINIREAGHGEVELKNNTLGEMEEVAGRRIESFTDKYHWAFPREESGKSGDESDVTGAMSPLSTLKKAREDVGEKITEAIEDAKEVVLMDVSAV